MLIQTTVNIWKSYIWTADKDDLFYPEVILLSRKLSQILIGILDARLLFKMSEKKN